MQKESGHPKADHPKGFQPSHPNGFHPRLGGVHAARGARNATLTKRELDEEECSNAGCKRLKKLLRFQVMDVNKQLDILSESLKNVTRMVPDP